MSKVNIRVSMEGDEAMNFLRLKKALGLKNNAEVVRMLITEASKAKASVQ
ncbi:MAG: hypothetical protein ACE5OZ_09660 [Candidatus Heimdallarchaeota archaeon]